jgi:predicted dehydrogenase
MAELMKVGMVGTSWWADLVLLPLFSSHERASVSAICSRTRDRAEELAAKFTVPQVFTDYREMITHGDLNAIVVATPDDLHYEIVMAALDAGLHVFCEKPIALNAQHAKAMLQKAEAAHLKHMVMYSWHWLPTIRHAKQLIDNGYLGTLYHGHMHWVTGIMRDGDYSWRRDAARANGVLGDLGSHLIHLALWFLGDVRSVSARLGFYSPRKSEQIYTPANDYAHLTLEFSSGAQLQIQLSWVDHLLNPLPVNVTLYGEKGTLAVEWAPAATFDTSLRAGQEDKEEQLHETQVIDLIDFFSTQPIGPRLFIDAIHDDQPIYPGLYEGYKVQQVIDAALQSHEHGSRVEIVP